jgi:K+-transporting ATPase KdpF subunit
LWRSPAAFSASPHFTFAFARRPDTMFDLILSAVLSLGLLGYLLFALLKPERF